MEKVKKMSKIFNSVVVSALGRTPIHYQLQASKEECLKLSERFDVPQILSLKAEISLFRDDFVHVKGKILAHMCRQSVVSLKKITEQMDETFDVLFSEPPIPETDEIVDEIHQGRIDLGEVISEQFGLALNPFPHAPDEKEGYVYMEEDSSSNLAFKNLSKIIKK